MLGGNSIGNTGVTQRLYKGAGVGKQCRGQYTAVLGEGVSTQGCLGKSSI